MSENKNNFALSNYTGDYQTDIKNPLHLKAHPENPREEINENDPDIQALAQDVIERGIIEPLVITPDDFILCGHRRQKAAIVAGLEFVPVVIRVLRSGEFVEDFFLSENGHRQNLSVLEEAKAIAALRAKLSAGGSNCGNNELARRLNMTPIVVAERMAILEMPERVKLLYHKNELPLASSRQLLKLKDHPGEIEKFADRLVTHQITGKSLATLIDRRLEDLRGLKFTPPRTKADGAAGAANIVLGDRTPALSRDSVVENLKNNSAKKISLFNVQILLDQTCCHCGMLGNTEVCGTCPLPKFVNGIIGRAEEKEPNQW